MKASKKVISKIACIAWIIIGIIACEGINERVLPTITGKSGELLVVVDSSYWNHRTGDALKEVFTQEQKGLPQREALFNLIQIPHRSFARIFQTHRNILTVAIKPQEKTKISIRKDVWAKEQLLISITAPNDKTAAATIQKNANAFLDYFNDKERERLQLAIKKNASNTKMNSLKDKLNLSIAVDDLFVIAKEEENFIWLRKEKKVGGHPVSQGIIIYTYPYTSDSTFHLASLIKKRDSITQKYINGGAKNSYMSVYKEYNPIKKEINLKGIYAKELRGLWQMKGDFMGGPYLNYSMIDEPRKRVITIDGYVYAPKFDKREYLRELEALLYTLTF